MLLCWKISKLVYACNFGCLHSYTIPHLRDFHPRDTKMVHLKG